MNWYTLSANETRKAIESLGGPMRVLVGAEDSARTISVLEQRLDTAGGPPLHIHDESDEILMVIDGGPLTVVVGTERRLVEKGESSVPTTMARRESAIPTRECFSYRPPL